MRHVRPHRPRPFAEFVLSGVEGLRVTLVKFVLVAYLIGSPLPQASKDGGSYR